MEKFRESESIKLLKTHGSSKVELVITDSLNSLKEQNIPKYIKLRNQGRLIRLLNNMKLTEKKGDQAQNIINAPQKLAKKDH